tara:strand:- start:137 stop:1261 length:1125 start_codon:yes stop_codon:yes gene_type:complete
MKKNNLYIGILSGTSMDSIDCGIFQFDKKKFSLISFSENEYPLSIKRQIIHNQKSVLKDHKNSSLNTELAMEYSKIINNLLQKDNIKNSDIKAIGMHGQTISHGQKNGKNFSIQIGCPLTLSNQTEIKVIAKFRQHDIQNGGSGAPLAPLFHEYLFHSGKTERVIVNIGGISNISCLSYGEKKLIGFDSGPGNTLIDAWMRKKFNIDFDKDGKTAAKASSNDELIKIFLEDKYFKLRHPKSTSTEYFSYDWILKNINKSDLNLNDNDILSTLTNLTALTIVQSINEYSKNCKEIYICGGGAKNNSIMKNIEVEAKRIISDQIIIKTTSDLNFHPKTVEAGLFAWLAMSKINNIKLDYRNITGSNMPTELGKIYF